MLQHINLYPQDVVKNKKHLNSMTIIIYSALLSLIMVAGIVWSYMDYQSIMSLSEKTDNNYKRMMAQYKEANKKLLVKIGKEGAGEATTKLVAQLEHNRSLLNVLQGVSDSTSSFLMLIKMIHESNIVGLKIDRLAITDSGNALVVEGTTQYSDSVSRYLKYLTQQPYFKGSIISQVSFIDVEGSESNKFKLVSNKNNSIKEATVSRSVSQIKSQLNRYFKE